MDIVAGVQSVLKDTLSMGDRAYQLEPDSSLLGDIPELDSMAVLSVLVGLEDRFDIVIDDDDVDASVFETLGSLVDLVDSKLKTG